MLLALSYFYRCGTIGVPFQASRMVRSQMKCLTKWPAPNIQPDQSGREEHLGWSGAKPSEGTFWSGGSSLPATD